MTRDPQSPASTPLPARPTPHNAQIDALIHLKEGKEKLKCRQRHKSLSSVLISPCRGLLSVTPLLGRRSCAEWQQARMANGSIPAGDPPMSVARCVLGLVVQCTKDLE
jgi:hypothetical protein